ncbi:hypothetical protein Bhyg_11963 [Pseudolycoriella hygida]|uniref:Uncharacterized protein n=1 Tax=Pseudolycoriella hygida TaxID=35572 RepID=A0A9Q0MWD3_9DIPT|nr:hypothetical protein Bhyg_11963 [Pseudolycoriella hygida]
MRPHKHVSIGLDVTPNNHLTVWYTEPNRSNSLPDAGREHIDKEEEYENEILRSDVVEDSSCPDLNNTISSFGKLIVNSYVDANQILNRNLESSSVTHSSSDVNCAHTEANKKRNRSEDITPVDSPNPTKKHRPIMYMFTMSDAVKMDNAGHMVDITSIDPNKPLSKAQKEDINNKITAALFTKEDISNIKFDGNKLRLIWKNDETRVWLVETVPKLTDLLDGVKVCTTELGSRPLKVQLAKNLGGRIGFRSSNRKEEVKSRKEDKRIWFNRVVPLLKANSTAGEDYVID